jgi:hypothetical protein
MSGIEACVFNAYGTLFDVSSVTGKLTPAALDRGYGSRPGQANN